jgi:hypothetical protein
MQKISSYLYSNRIQLIADVTALDATYPVEWKIVYQRPVKIYKGVDNVIELDVKNADQKRIDIFGKTIKFVVMDQTDKEINTYTATVLDDGSTTPALKGLAKVTIAEGDLTALDPQYLKYSVYMLNSDSTKTLIYGDTRFGGHGTLEVLSGIIPKIRPTQTYDDFQQETNYQGLTLAERIITYYSTAIPVKFYEAEPTTSVEITVTLTDFVGTVGIQGTKKATIGHEAFKDAPFNTTQVFDEGDITGTETVTFTVDTTNLTYLRVTYIKTAGTVDFFTVIS